MPAGSCSSTGSSTTRDSSDSSIRRSPRCVHRSRGWTMTTTSATLEGSSPQHDPGVTTRPSMWFPLEPTELDFVDRSKHRFENEAVIDAPAERVFELLSDGERMGDWFTDFVACRWTSPGPHGVGSTREIQLKAL